MPGGSSRALPRALKLGSYRSRPGSYYSATLVMVATAVLKAVSLSGGHTVATELPTSMGIKQSSSLMLAMRFGTTKTQLGAVGGYFSLTPWLNNPFSKWWSGICAFRNMQNSDRYFSYIYIYIYICIFVYICIYMYLCIYVYITAVLKAVSLSGGHTVATELPTNMGIKQSSSLTLAMNICIYAYMYI